MRTSVVALFVQGCVTAGILGGCASAVPASAPGQILPARTFGHSRQTQGAERGDGAQSTLLVITEQGNTEKQGLVEIFTAPFNSPPHLIRRANVVGSAIAPDGALILASDYDGIFVSASPFKGRPQKVFDEYSPSGVLFFDSKDRLFDLDREGGVFVFDPPYTSKPSLDIPLDYEEAESATLDAKNDLFWRGGGEINECLPPQYGCNKLLKGGVPAIDKPNGNLYASLGDSTVAEFAPPYTDGPIAKAQLPFMVQDVLVAHGEVFAGGAGSRSKAYLAVIPTSLKRKAQVFPMEAYDEAHQGFAVAKNGELFITNGNYQKPCVSIHPFPYTKAPHRCIETRYPVMSLSAL